MYESPIEIIYGQLQTQLDGDIFRAVQKAGILVNKEELTKALQYDREQYVKGRRDGIKEFAERLKESSFECDVSIGLGVEMVTEAVSVSEIDSLVKEMAGER